MVQTSTPLISIICLTYNHEKFIRQALEGFVMQKTNFSFEIIVHDDASTDNTVSFIKEYELKFPDLFANIYQTENQYSKKDNQIGSIVFKAARGKYIALCDGDDYWTNPNKLQKQVDFLEANSNYSICFHAVNTLSNGIEKRSTLNLSGKEETYSILDLAELNMIPTASVVFRNGLFDKFPNWFNESPVGDYVLHLLNAKKGLIKYFPQIMAVYRAHDKSVWAQQDMSIVFPKWLWVLDKLQHEDFDEEVRKKISAQKNKNFNDYIKLLLDRREYALIKESYQRFYKTDEVPDIDSLMNLFIKTIGNLNNAIDGIKSTRAYKAGKNFRI